MKMSLANLNHSATAGPRVGRHGGMTNESFTSFWWNPFQRWLLLLLFLSFFLPIPPSSFCWLALNKRSLDMKSKAKRLMMVSNFVISSCHSFFHRVVRSGAKPSLLGRLSKRINELLSNLSDILTNVIRDSSPKHGVNPSLQAFNVSSLAAFSFPLLSPFWLEDASVDMPLLCCVVNHKLTAWPQRNSHKSHRHVQISVLCCHHRVVWPRWMQPRDEKSTKKQHLTT